MQYICCSTQPPVAAVEIVNTSAICYRAIQPPVADLINIVNTSAIYSCAIQLPVVAVEIVNTNAIKYIIVQLNRLWQL